MDAEIFVPFIFFLFLGAIILLPIWFRERTKQSAHHLISQALEKGQQLDPALIRQISDGGRPPQDKARRTLGSGIVLLALAGGFVGAAYVIDGVDASGSAHSGMMVPAVILGALGTAFVLLAIVDYMTRTKDQ
jgi:Domain of unknown function (DUF6249)